MSLLQNSNAIGGGNYQIANSLRFQSASSQYLNRTPASAGNRQTWTWSAGVKRGALGSDVMLFSGSDNGTTTVQWCRFTSSNTLEYFEYNGSTTTTNLATSAVFRDPSAWYHVVIVFNSTESTSTNRVKIYVNGIQQTISGTYPSLNQNSYWNSNNNNRIGREGRTFSDYFDGYMTEVNFIDGQALTPSSFGETNTLTGQWVAKKYTGTYGTNGFYLPFSNGTSTTTLGNDSSGNGNNWTLTNFTRSAGVSDCWMYDVPSGNGGASGTQPSSNYAVMNPLAKDTNSTISNSNLRITGYNSGCLASIVPAADKYYWEVTLLDGYFSSPIYYGSFGLGVTSGASQSAYVVAHTDGTSGGLYLNNVRISTFTTFALNDVLGLAYDGINNTLAIYRNNIQIGSTITTVPSGLPIFSYQNGISSDTSASAINFGQRSFAYTPPSGFKALCTANLPASTIVKGNQYMDATLVTGTGGVQTITNAGGFSPDFIWSKGRSAVSNNVLVDAVRGIDNFLWSNATNAEQSGSGYTSLNSNGFSVNGTFSNGVTYVAWQWDAGSSTVTNTSGTISSQVRANPTAGFSIVTYTGQASAGTIGHGLGIAPSMIISKCRTSGADGWTVYHKSIGATNILALNSTIASTANGAWNNTSPTSSVFSVGGGSFGTNINGGSQLAYCFAEIAGFSKFGSYTGNGSADNVFVYCGFKPRFIMTKRTDSTGSWYMFDTARNTYNVLGEELIANTSAAGVTATDLDILSNGFKWRAAISGTWIFMAFAENPFAQANAF